MRRLFWSAGRTLYRSFLSLNSTFQECCYRVWEKIWQSYFEITIVLYPVCMVETAWKGNFNHTDRNNSQAFSLAPYLGKAWTYMSSVSLSSYKDTIFFLELQRKMWLFSKYSVFYMWCNSESTLRNKAKSCTNSSQRLKTFGFSWQHYINNLKFSKI